MPDVSDITSTAVQLARRKGKSPAARQLKDPKKMAAAGAALMALPFAAEGIAKLAGGSPKEAAKDAGRKAKGKAAESAKKLVDKKRDERIEWHAEQGLAHSGVVTFHKLAPRLTRIEVSMDVKPDSLLEKAGRGMRFTKRAVRGDLHRFKAFVEMEEDKAA